jgi:cardiolipin synthase A/B
MTSLIQWIREKKTPRAIPSDIDSAVHAFPGTDETRWGRFLTTVAALPGVESSGGNSVEILEGGEPTLIEMERAIDAAKTRVWLETYIFDSSPEVAGRIVQGLIRAAQRGCDVVLVVDYIGSGGLVEWKDKLRENGVEVVLFNPFPWSHWLDNVPKSVGPIPFRNHRKTLIADNVGFCGSMNIQREVGDGSFFDLNAKISGPAVAHLANVFRDSLEESGLGITRGPIEVPAPTGSSYVQVLQSNVRRDRKAIQKALARQIKESRFEVLVASSYFMPPGFLKRALLGVATKRDHSPSLSILVSGTTDFFPVPGDLLAQTHALSRFIERKNTSVFLYSASHMHAKFTVVDSTFVCLGSYNFDRFSSRRNLEAAIGVFDPEVAGKVRQIHRRLSANSALGTREDSMYFHNPIARGVCWIAYLVMKYSGRNLFDGFDAYGKNERMEQKRLLYFDRPEIFAAAHPF